MATYYVDLENGNDANDGTSFANRKKTITSAVASATTAGDDIRVMATPDSTNVGTATWPSNKRQYSFSVPSILSTTNASPIVVTTNGAHGLLTDEYIILNGHLVNTNANGFWKITVINSTSFSLNGSTGNGVGATTGAVYLQSVVEVASGVTKNIACIDNGRTAWTLNSTNSTSYQTNAGPFATVDRIVVAATFTTGKIAYKATGTLNLSSYTQISFWIRQTSGTSTTQAYQIKLCSDTTGDTAVNTINIPALQTTYGRYITVDTGAALGSNIQSIALYCTTDIGSAQFDISDIIACKSSSSNDCITLNSLISAEDDHTKPWYAIKAIIGNLILIKGGADSSLSGSYANKGYYYGLTGSQNIYQRKQYQTAFSASTTYLAQLASTTVGVNSSNHFTISGGWNTTDMSTKTSRTYINGSNNTTIAFYSNLAHNYLTISDFTICNFNSPISISVSPYDQRSINLDNIGLTSNSGNIDIRTIDSNFSIDYGVNNGSTHFISLWQSQTLDMGIVCGCIYPIATGNSGPYAVNTRVTNINVISQVSMAILGLCDYDNIGLIEYCTAAVQNAANLTANVDVIDNCRQLAQSTISNVKINVNTISNTASSLVGGTTTTSQIDNLIFNGATSTNPSEYSWGPWTDQNASSRVSFTNIGGDSTAAITYIPQLTYKTQTAVRHTASGVAWKATLTTQTTTAKWSTANRPAQMPLAKIACSANSLVTVKAWLRRDSTDLSASLFCPKKQLSGMTSDASASITASIDTWQELTITFTPTQAGVVEIFVNVWATDYTVSGNGTSVYIDDLTVTQA